MRTPTLHLALAMLLVAAAPLPAAGLVVDGIRSAAAEPAPEPLQAADGAGGQEAGPGVADQEPGSELRVWLVTIGPGSAVWERFGHNALRILDLRTGRDVSYNWGIFDFDQVDFIPRFLKGQMLYSMAPYDSRAMIQAYGSSGREVVLQQLALTPAERVALRDVVETNALPENRDYFYDYFLDNCSTRVRDVLDRALGGALSARFEAEPTGTSYRYHIRRLTDMDPWLFTGMDLLLGTPGDRPISVWEEMFLPMTLRDALREVTVPGPDGASRSLVAAEEVVLPGSVPPESEAPPAWMRWYVLLGLALGVCLAGAGARAGRLRRRDGTGTGARLLLAVVGGAWSVLAGVAGAILVAVLFTDHRFMAGNENMFLFTPLSLLVAAGVVVAASRGATPSWALRAAWVVVLVAAIGAVGGLLPLGGQQNAIFEAMALPAHLGLALGLGWMGRGSPASDDSR